MLKDVHYTVIRPAFDDSGAVIQPGAYKGTRTIKENAEGGSDSAASWDHRITSPGIMGFHVNNAVRRGDVEVRMRGSDIILYSTGNENPTGAL